MKKIILLIILVFTNGILLSQKTVGGKVIDNAKNKTYQKGEQKGDEIIDNTLNNIEDGIKSIFKKKKKKTVVEEEPKEETDKTKNVKKNLSNSKFDFEPGKKQLAFDDFSTTNLGDFPLGWNTNSSAELRTLDNSNQKWFAMTKDGFFMPEYIKDMPENFTIEFEVFTRYNSNNLLMYSIYLNAVENPKKDLDNKYIQNGVYFGWRPCVGESSFFVYENGEIINKNEDLNIEEFQNDNCEDATIAKVSIWRQKGRLRLYINQSKILDIPQAFDTQLNYNSFKFGTSYMNFSNSLENQDEFMISNIRYAVAGEDTRSKLITEGRFVTNGILFDVNSDNIKPESGKILKEIAGVLSENPTIRIKIIGHTDADGDANANLILSKKRAESVKNALSGFYEIDALRIETDGFGESKPLNKNLNEDEKAQNRRVEFIKL